MDSMITKLSKSLFPKLSKPFLSMKLLLLSCCLLVLLTSCNKESSPEIPSDGGGQEVEGEPRNIVKDVAAEAEPTTNNSTDSSELSLSDLIEEKALQMATIYPYQPSPEDLRRRLIGINSCHL